MTNFERRFSPPIAKPVTDILVLCVFALAPVSPFAQQSTTKEARVAAVRAERQPAADLGGGLFRNPILAGNYADNSVVRVGRDYFMVHCCGKPRGMLVWHSRDLVNWEPYSYIDVPAAGAIWAPDLSYVNGLFYLYLPMMHPGTGTIWVMTAESMKGPWSQPIDLGVPGIDPGPVVDTQGNRYLYVDGGRVVPLTRDGLKANGELKKVYSGWQFPKDWVVECFCLESPKLIHHGGYFYLVSAEGGTEGPSTSHMAVVARSASPTGPWEDSPYNPLVHTIIRSERWWSQGHGVLVDDIDGNWWMIYHAIENGYRSLGRQTLLLPISWSADGWPRVTDDAASNAILHKPSGDDVGDGMPLSDTFESRELGMQWNYAHVTDPKQTIHSGGGELRLEAGGPEISDAPMVLINPVNHAYAAEVEVEIPSAAQAGLVLSAGGSNFTGGILKNGELDMYVRGKQHLKRDWQGDRAFVRVVDLNHDISVYYSEDGAKWERFDFGIELDGISNVRLGLLASGNGTATFRNFTYHGLDSMGLAIR